MRKSVKTIASVCCILGLTITLILLNKQNGRRESRLRAHVVAENVNRIKGLQTGITRVAAVNPMKFADAVTTGVTCEARSLPGAILAELPPTMQAEELDDTFGHPIHVALSRRIAGSTAKSTKYDLFMWSDGPNGINEQGKGDDIVLPNQEIKLE